MIYRILLLFSLTVIPLVTFAQERVVVTDPEIKFSYVLPEGWMVDDDGYDYKIQSQEQGDTYLTLTYFENAKGSEYVESLGGKLSFEDDFLYEIRSVLPETYPNLKALENGTLKVDGVSARWMKFSYGTNGDKMGVFYMYQKLNQTFKITGTALADQFEKVKPIFTTIVHSLQAEKR